MNVLQKLMTLLSKSGRQIKYGEAENDSSDPLILIAAYDSQPAKGHLGERCIEYQAVSVSVLASDYIVGYDLMSQLKLDIAAAQKDTVNILFAKDLTPVMSGEKYLFKSIFNIIKL